MILCNLDCIELEKRHVWNSLISMTRMNRVTMIQIIKITITLVVRISQSQTAIL